MSKSLQAQTSCIAAKESLRQYGRWGIFGFLMGSANVIPGVSGGTVAFILGFYPRLIDSLKQLVSRDAFRMYCHFDVKAMYEKLPWRFLGSIAFGAGVAVLTLAQLMKYLLQEQESAVYAFFIGLILTSVAFCFKMVRSWDGDNFIALLIGVGIGYGLIKLVPTQTPDSWWCILLCGVIAISAMILPGISGSFMLLLLGQYYTVLDAVTWKGFNLEIIVIFGAGCLIGLGSVAHLLSWLFNRYRDVTTATMIGFMLGSLVKLWPWQQVVSSVEVDGQWRVLQSRALMPHSFGWEFWGCVFLMVLGAGITILIESYAGKEKHTAN